MSWVSALAIYFVVWWMTLFISLPLGMRSQVEVDDVTEGTEPAAPHDPQLLRRMGWNTVLSGLIFGVFYLVFYVLDYSLEDLPQIFTPQTLDG